MNSKVMELNKLHIGISNEDYHADPNPGSSALKMLMRSPKYFKMMREQKMEPTEAMRRGSLVHSMLENGPSFVERLIVRKKFDRRTKVGKEEAERFEKDLPSGAIVADEDDVEMLKGISKSIVAKPVVRNLMKDGTREASVWIKDPETGVTLKCRPDLISAAGYLVDYKSTRDARPHSFLRDVFSPNGFFYIFQLAFYNHVLKTAGITNGQSATIIAIETVAPFDIWVHAFDHAHLEVGEHYRRKLTRLYADCLEKDEWPGYPDKVQPTVMPNWVQYLGEDEV